MLIQCTFEVKNEQNIFCSRIIEKKTVFFKPMEKNKI